MTGTYDPQLDLVYVGTGNPTPVLNGDARPGDNTWTNSIVALHPETGRMEWGFQTTPHDTHDWDAAEVPVLVDGTFDGVQRKMLLQAGRNGYFFVLDRANGTNLKTVPFAAVELGDGDRQGRTPDSESRQGTLARWPTGRAERGRRHQLSIAELRSQHRPLHRQRAGQLRDLFLQTGAWQLRMGGRRLQRLRPRRPPGDRLQDRHGSVVARSRRRRRAGRRPDHCVRTALLGR